MPKTSHSLRVVAADEDPDLGRFYKEVFPRLGHQVCVARSGRQLVELCRSLCPDLVITDYQLSDLDGIEAARAICQDKPMPVILVSSHSSPEILQQVGESGILACLVKPITEAQLKTVVAKAAQQFERLESLQQEIATLRQALMDREVIERARGILMRRGRLDEDQAFRRLQHLSRNRNTKLVDIARQVVMAEEAFGPPAQTPADAG